MNAAEIASQLPGGHKGKLGGWLAICPRCGDDAGVLLSDNVGAVVLERNCKCAHAAVRDAVRAKLDGADVDLLTPAEARMRDKRLSVSASSNGEASGQQRSSHHEFHYAGSNLITGAEFRAEFKPMKFVIEGMLPPGSLTTLTGMGNVGKTPALMLMCACVLTGAPFNGRKVKQGSVLYVQGENVEDFRRRYIAMHDHFPGFKENERGFHIYRPKSGPDLVAMLAEVEAFATKPGVEFVLVAIDTLAAWSPQDHDEIDNTDQGAYAQMLRRLNALAGMPAVVAAAHPAKRPNSALDCRPRGGVGLENQTDNNWTMWNKDDLVEVGHTRLRVPHWELFSIRLKEITATSVKDIDDAPVVSVMAEFVTEAEQEQVATKARTGREAIIRAMFPATANAFTSQKSIAVAAGLVLASVKKTDNRLRIAQKLVSRMIADKTIERAQEHYRLSPKARKYAVEVLGLGG